MEAERAIRSSGICLKGLYRNGARPQSVNLDFLANIQTKTWPLKLRENHRLGEKRVLRMIFGPRRDEVMRGWRKLHNEEIRDLYSLPSIIRIIKSRMRWAGYEARMGEKKNVYSLLLGKPEGDC
jgi:hypothetical protein